MAYKGVSRSIRHQAVMEVTFSFKAKTCFNLTEEAAFNLPNNNMVSEKKPFTPTDYEELMNPQEHVERVVLNENNVFTYLESLGYDSSKLVKRNDN